MMQTNLQTQITAGKTCIVPGDLLNLTSKSNFSHIHIYEAHIALNSYLTLLAKTNKQHPKSVTVPRSFPGKVKTL